MNTLHSPPTEDALARAKALFFEGIASYESADYPAAARQFEAALALAPGRPSVLANLGAARVRLNQYAEAVPVLEQALQGDAQQGEAWGHLGTALQQLGRLPQAVDAFRRALDLNVGVVEVWSRCGSCLRELGRLPEAADCFERAIALGADDPLHRYYLAAARGDSSVQAPREYVEGLFDQYAHEFDSHLTQALRYETPSRLMRCLDGVHRGRWRHCADLGCGTGLMGKLLRPRVDVQVGVDLSAGMLEQARAAGYYDELVHGDVAEWLAMQPRAAFDLIVAADVLVYVGALERTFDAAARALGDGGWFAFSVEALDQTGEDLRLQGSLRYAHHLDHLRRLARTHGLTERVVERVALREDQGRPVMGWCTVWQAPQAEQG